MPRKVTLNKTEGQRLYRPTLFALLDNLAQADCYKGEVIVMDIHDASIVSWASLEESKGTQGELVFYASHMKKVNFISIETEESRGYIEKSYEEMFPIEAIMPVVSYLTFMHCGFQPSDTLEWNGGSTTLEEAFVKGLYTPLNNAIMQLASDGIEQLIDYMCSIGIIPLYPNNIPYNLQEVMRNELADTVILEWISQLALGEGIKSQYCNEEKDSEKNVISAEIVKMTKEILRKSGTENIVKSAYSDEKLISGYTYVSTKDKNRNWHAYSLGYFPVDNPKYSIMIRMDRHEQLQDVVRDDWPELGKYAANLCNKVVEIMCENSHE